MHNLKLGARAGAIGAAAFFLAATGSAHAVVITYMTGLSGPEEFPVNGSPGIGSAIVDIDTVAHAMRVRATFSGLTGVTTASHIHATTTAPFFQNAGVASQTPSFSGFPLGVSSGSMDTTFDMTLASSYNAAFITANGGTPLSAEAALFSAMAQSRAYLNIHSSTFGGGEIRGFLPSPGAGMVVGLGGLLAMGRRRR